jgi:hypothetical protein
MRTPVIMEKIDFLGKILKIDAHDGGPGQPGPVYRSAIANYVVAENLRDVGARLTDKSLGRQLHGIGKELVSESSKNLAADWDEGDDICPPWFVPHKVSGQEPDPNRPWEPDPSPWMQFLKPNPSPWLGHVTPALNDIVLAVAVRELASLTTSEKASAAMKQVGEAIVKGASSRLFDEYCATPVKPRPVVGPRAVAV